MLEFTYFRTSDNLDEARNDDSQYQPSYSANDEGSDHSDDSDELVYEADSDCEDAAANLIQTLTAVPPSKGIYVYYKSSKF